MDNPAAVDKTAPATAQMHREQPMRPDGGAIAQERFAQALERSARPLWEEQPLSIPLRAVLPVLAGIEAAATPPPAAESHSQLPELLQKACSAMYVGESAQGQPQRVMLTLDGALLGATAQIVREGSLVTIRLRAGSESIYRLMSSQRDALARAIEGCGARQVIVEVTRGAGESDGSVA